MENQALPSKIERLYAKLNRVVVLWSYTSAHKDKIEVTLGGSPPETAEWEHNGMSWQPVKPPRRN